MGFVRWQVKSPFVSVFTYQLKRWLFQVLGKAEQFKRLLI